VKDTSKFILLLDPSPEVLSLQEISLSCFYGGKVFSTCDPHKAQSVLSENGTPEMVILDSSFLHDPASSLYQRMSETNFSAPIIVCAQPPLNHRLQEKFPSVTAVIEKPLSSSSFTYLVKSISSTSVITPSYVPVPLSVLLRLGIGLFDLYLKLSEANFVKLIHKGEPFFESDAEKLISKGVGELYVRSEDSKKFIQYLESQLHEDALNGNQDVSLTLENLEAFERIGKRMGWDADVLVAAERSIHHALKILSRYGNVVNVIKKRMSEKGEPYSKHISLQTYLLCAFGSTLGWIGEAGQVKLALAALLHDITVDEEIYKNLSNWNHRAANPLDKSEETLRYRMHPFEASKIARSLDSISPDVEQIILQHHEQKDGSGFPRALDASRISPLSALFIIVEDFVEFIGDGENLETSITDFFMWGSASYDLGHFAKIFKALETKLKN
jgi:HD-GYP domain-containing protein (c-di-GMP phosphodiesterase class II)